MDKRIDIMTDIETLGTDANSTIIQIGAMAFDIRTGEELYYFDMIADIEKNERRLEVDGGTIKWWLKTDKDLFQKLLNNGKESSEDVIVHFNEWLHALGLEFGYKNLYMWGNGILFDNKMIQHQMEALGLDYPIHFRNDRDLRTLVELATLKTGEKEWDLKKRFKDEGLRAHDALDDVKFQIKVANGCYRILKD